MERVVERSSWWSETQRLMAKSSASPSGIYLKNPKLSLILISRGRKVVDKNTWMKTVRRRDLLRIESSGISHVTVRIVSPCVFIVFSFVTVLLI
jgi:hypothetical protein